MEELYEYRRGLIDRYHAAASDLVSVFQANRLADRSTEPEDGELSPETIITHLLKVEESIFLPYLMKILEEDLPCLEHAQASHENLDVVERNATPVMLLKKFQHLRDQQVKLLLNLPQETWSRSGWHSVYGVRTLQW